MSFRDRPSSAWVASSRRPPISRSSSGTRSARTRSRSVCARRGATVALDSGDSRAPNSVASARTRLRTGGSVLACPMSSSRVADSGSQRPCRSRCSRCRRRSRPRTSCGAKATSSVPCSRRPRIPRRPSGVSTVTSSRVRASFHCAAASSAIGGPMPWWATAAPASRPMGTTPWPVPASWRSSARTSKRGSCCNGNGTTFAWASGWLRSRSTGT